MKKPRIALIGNGQRGDMILKDELIPMEKDGETEIVAICDEYLDRAEDGAKAIKEQLGKAVFVTTDYREILDRADVEAVLIMTAWEAHVDIATSAMKAGKFVGLEVGGAYTVEDCWKLVNTYEETGVPCMLLENCCYGQRELMILNMVRAGKFGRIVHCSGGYGHDLRYEISHGEENRHYRLRNYLTRNCENYPTHELGPIAKLLDINNGNRIVSLVSVASAAGGLSEYIQTNFPTDHKLQGAHFHQGDIVTTVLTCQNGETVVLQLDTTLPRTYSRDFTVRGTKGGYFGANDTVFEDGKHNKYDEKGYEIWRNACDYEASEQHPIWRTYDPEGGHGGMDWLVIEAFLDAVRSNKRPPIDVYDAATYMAVTALSEVSVAHGGTPVAMPDFTRGKWHHRTDLMGGAYNLDRLDAPLK